MSEANKPALANVGALGLGGFALSTFILNIVNAGWVDASAIGIVMPVAMLYGGLAQFMAGMWDVRRGDIFGATCFTSFGAFWMGLALFFFMKFAGIQAFVDVTPAGVAIVLIAWGIFTFYATIASLKLPRVITWVFITLTILFFLLAIGEFVPVVHTIAGYEGVLCALIAWYASAGTLINTVHGKTVLPLGVRK
ncbi:MAG TPA: transcriptional regulator [Candidatus Acetothermia bacterium]|nr:transcriptional regulator [Candidatus Acetothermia bacterium]